MSHLKISFGLLLFAMLFPLALKAQTPVAAFTADTTTGCAPFPLVVNFQDQSTNNPTSWLWFFGDANGSSSTLQNPAFVYSAPGCYNITLIAANANGGDTLTQSCFIEIYPQPTPDFTVDFPVGCAPLTVTFSDISIPNAASIIDWNWTLTSNNIPLTGQNPSFTFPTTDTTGVILTVTNSNGCQNTIVVPDVVQVLPPSQADFSVDVNSACNPPLTVNFTNNSQINAAQNVQYQWSFPGGQISGGGSTFTGQTPPPVTYNADGQYDVTLIVNSSNSCNDTLTLTNLIGIGGVTADFTANDTVVCVGDVVNFTSNSSGGVSSLEWDIDGDGVVDGTGQQFSFTYNTAGTYTVSLAANNAQCGDTIVRVNHITVFDSPTADYTVNKTADCIPGLPFNFTDQSTGVVSWSWDFDDGNTSTQQSPTHTFANFGTYDVCLTVTNANNCTDVFCQTITIEPVQANIAANIDEGCVPHTVGFSDASTSPADPIVSWQWDFGSAVNVTPPTSNAQNPTATFNAPGMYDITLIIVTANGCTDTVTQNNRIEVGSLPPLDFNSTKDTVCINEDITFNSVFTDPSWDYFWDFQYSDPGNFQQLGDTATTVYSDTGYFSVGLVILNSGCRDTLIIDSMVYVNPPDARFFPSDLAVCFPPQTISFADSSIGPVDVYEWYVNGVFYSDQPTPPDLNITAPGDYLVTQIVLDTTAVCSDTANIIVSAGDPQADFTAAITQACRPGLIPFTNLSQNATGYNWKFNIGAQGFLSSGVNPGFVYPDTGTYSVRLIATDNLGCRDTMIRNDYITIIGPYADFSPLPGVGCPPLPVNFLDNTVTSSQSTPTAWNWDFGDASPPSTAQNPNHIYTNPGTYDVTLTVTDDAGCSDQITIPAAVTVTLPIVDFSVSDDTTCAGNDLNFTSTSTGVGPLTYLWDFGDGNTDTIQSPVHAYADTGSYTVTLIVIDANGCSDTLVRPDFVYVEFFQAGFFGDPRIGICPPLTTAFTDTTIGNVVSWQWDFGTGINFSNIQNPQNVYFSPGNFDVSLIATHEDGCRDTATVVDYIQLNGPSGSFSLQPPNACLGDTVCIEAILLGTDIAIADWKNGATAVLQNLTGVADTVSTCIVYNNPGKFFPEMVLTDNNGCSTTITSPDSTQIYVLPQAQIAPLDSTGCLPFEVPFIDNSIIGDTIVNNWTWLFGDGDTSFVQNPIHTFNLDSTFTVTLAIEDVNGCVDTTSTSVTSFEGTIGDFSATDTAGCAPFTVTFNDGSTNLPPINYVWIFGDGDTLSGLNTSPTHTYTSNGVYDVTLIVADNLGCSDTVVKQQYIVLNNPVANVYADTVFGCNPVNLTFFADSSVIDTNRTVVQYEWCLVNINTGQVNCVTTTEDSLIQAFNVGGDFAMILTVTDSEGCTGVSDSLEVTINTRVIPNPLEMRNVSVVDDNSAEITWIVYPGNDFVEYAVYRTSGPGSPELVGTITDQATSVFVHNDPGINFRDQSYCYKVLVQNNCLEYSLLDDTEEHCTIDLEVNSGTDELILNWSPYVGYGVASYEVFRATDYDPNNLVQIGVVAGTVLTFTDRETFCSDSISYRIRAIGAAPDERSLSDLDANAPFHPLPTESSHILTATVVQDTFIDVSWTDYGGYRPAGYYIERSLDGVVWDSLASTPITQTSYQDQDVEVDEFSYFYRVFATDECGDISVEGRLGKSIVLSATIDQSGKVPVLVWSAYEEWLNGVRNYQIEVFNEDAGVWEVVSQTGPANRRFEDEVTTLFQPTYCYRVRAFETGNFAQEALSNEVCVTFGPVVFTPNAFTPNNDGHNDEFRVFVPNLRVGELVIFNRWGEELYRSNDLTIGWDGTRNGQAVPEGVYVFVVSGIGENGDEFNRSGTVTLFR